MRIYEACIITDDIANAFSKLIPQLSANSTVPSKTDLDALLKSDSTIVLLAEDEAEDIIGTLTLVFNKIPTGNKAWIEDLVVDITARGKGIGEKLTEFAINYASNKGINEINLTSNPERIAANKLYQKLGFERRKTNVYRLTI